MDYAAQQAIQKARSSSGLRDGWERTREGHVRNTRNGQVRVDVNRGVIQRPTPSGMLVVMYMDQPGFYYTIKADPVPPEVARKAGFDTEALERQREINADRGRVQEAMSAVQLQQAPEEVLAEAGPYRVVSVGEGQCIVTRDGERLMDNPCSEALARELFTDLSAQVEAAEGGQ